MSGQGISNIEAGRAMYGGAGDDTSKTSGAPGAGDESLFSEHGGIRVEKESSIGQYDSPVPQPKNPNHDSREDRQKPDGESTPDRQTSEGQSALDLNTLAQMGVGETVIDDLRGLPAEQAQRLVQAHQDVSTRYWNDLDVNWNSSLQREFGTELDAAATEVNSLFRRYDHGNELVGFLKQTRMQNCAPLFRFLHRISRDL